MGTKSIKKPAKTATKVKKVKQRIVGLKELRENMDEYIEALDRGEKVTVVRRSKPIFVMQHPDDDEDQWETVVDFTEIDPRGVPVKEVLKALRSMK